MRQALKPVEMAAGSALLAVSLLWSSASVQAQAIPRAVAQVKHSAAIAATVTIHPRQMVAVVPPLAYGMNTAVWDGNLYTASVPSRLKQLGTRLLRWPGGSYADTFHWNSAPFEFDQFMQLSKQVGALPVITVNYGTGSPKEAADWVKYAVQHHDHAWWEIGNEVYGNGSYQNVNWEADYHTKKGPAAYGKNALQYINAMRKVNPDAQIGIVATIPSVWPSGIAPYWDRTLLPIVGKQINFVIIHWYPQNPGQESDAGLLSSTDAIAGYMSQLKAYIQQYCGTNAKHIKILLDETNSVSSNPGKQMMSVVNALFLAKDYNSWLENGADNVSWWVLHNNAIIGNTSSTLYGNATYGDYGILSNGDPGEPPLNTPTPSFWGLRLQELFAGPSDHYLQTSSDQSLVSAYAVQKGKQETRLMLVNADPNTAYQVTLKGLKVAPGAMLTELSYGEKSPTIEETHVKLGSSGITLPPYTMMMVEVPTQG